MEHGHARRTSDDGAGRHAATESYPLRVPAAVAVVGRGEVVVDGGGLPFGTPAFELSGDDTIRPEQPFGEYAS